MKSRTIDQNNIPSININKDTGVKIAINNDPNRIIYFNPKDVNFTQKFYSLFAFLEVKQKEYEEKANELKLTSEKETAAKLIINFVSSLCDELNAKIDEIFGEGTSWTLFQGAKVFNTENNQYIQFFKGITPFVMDAREDVKSKYKNSSKVLKK